MAHIGDYKPSSVGVGGNLSCIIDFAVQWWILSPKPQLERTLRKLAGLPGPHEAQVVLVQLSCIHDLEVEGLRFRGFLDP